MLQERTALEWIIVGMKMLFEEVKEDQLKQALESEEITEEKYRRKAQIIWELFRRKYE